MAGQEEAQAHRMIKRKVQELRHNWLAVDPGDRWAGFARLAINQGAAMAETGVLDVAKRSFRDTVDFLLGGAFRGTLVVEQYRQRPQGHNAFDGGETLQLMGALRYFADARSCAWALVPAGDPDRELPMLGLDGFVERYRRYWPDKGNQKWQHARAAWRHLGMHLLKAQPELMLALGEPLDPKLSPSDFHQRSLFDLNAPVIHWRFHAADRARTEG